MTRDEAIKVQMIIQAAYPNYKPVDKTVTVNLWYEMLLDYSYEQVCAAVNTYIRTDTSGFAPKIGDIIDKIQMLFGEEDENEGEAWNLVIAAIGKSGYYSEEEFYKLPKLVQKVIGSPSQLRSWALSETFNEGVESSNFKKVYRLEKQREAEFKKLPPDLKKLVDSKRLGTQKEIADKHIGIESNNALKTERVGREMPEHLKERLRELLGEEDGHK